MPLFTKSIWGLLLRFFTLAVLCGLIVGAGMWATTMAAFADETSEPTPIVLEEPIVEPTPEETEEPEPQAAEFYLVPAQYESFTEIGTALVFASALTTLSSSALLVTMWGKRG